MFKFSIKQSKRSILHIDADAFFASVEQALNPSLKGLPVIVGGSSEDSGIVCAASYEAKKLGVKTGMPFYLAKRKVPSAVFLAANFGAYRDFSKRMYEIFLKYTPYVEMASIDEAYLDITGFDIVYKKQNCEIARAIMIDVYKSLGISVSCGLSTNKTVSKTASSINKPHKLTVIPFGKEASFLAPLAINAIHGIGPKTFEIFERCGFKRVDDLAKLSSKKVMEIFGLKGVAVWKKCRGIDTTEVCFDSVLPKSISKENSFYPYTDNERTCLTVLKNLSATVFEKLRSHNMKAKTIFVKIRYRNFEKYDHQRFFKNDQLFQKHLGAYFSSDRELFPMVKDLFLENCDRSTPIRLLGIGVTNLQQHYNLDLFSSEKVSDELFKAIDSVKKIHGDDKVQFGGF